MVISGPQRKEYLKWKRANVSYRGMKEIGKENGAGAMMGDGLYSASLSNKSMARQYGKVSLAVGAVPKNPKVVDSLNAFEIFQQRVIAKWCEENGIEYSARKFREETDLRTQVMRMGYDGIVITGREMVNYTPGAVRYFDDYDELEQWWLDNVAVNESFQDRNQYIYHGTGKGQALNIQKDRRMKPNNTGEGRPSISFTAHLDYAEHYAKAKGGISKMCVLRTRLTDEYVLSQRISDNRGYEYVIFDEVPSANLEVMTRHGWKPLDTWDVIFDEPLSIKERQVMSFRKFLNEALRHSMTKMDLSDFKYAFHWVNEGLLFDQLYDMDDAHSGPYVLRKSNGKKIEMPPLPAERMVFGNRDPDARVTTKSSMGNEVCMTVDPEYAAAGMTGGSNVCFVFDLPGLMRDYDVKNLTDNGEAEVRVLRIDDPKKYIVRIFVPTKVWDRGDGWEGFHYRAIKEWFPDSLKPLVVVTRSNKDTVHKLKSMVGGK